MTFYYQVDEEKKTLINIDEKETFMKKENKEYEVSFVIYGYTETSLAPIGSAEASDEYKNEDGTYTLVDCRANYCISTTSPEEAYQQAVDKFEEDDFGELEITDWCLEHIYCKDDNRYFNEVTKDKKSNMRYWDAIDDFVSDFVENFIKTFGFDEKSNYVSEDIFSDDTIKEAIVDIAKEVTDKIVNSGIAQFPYVDENY